MQRFKLDQNGLNIINYFGKESSQTVYIKALSFGGSSAYKKITLK